MDEDKPDLPEEAGKKKPVGEPPKGAGPGDVMFTGSVRDARDLFPRPRVKSTGEHVEESQEKATEPPAESSGAEVHTETRDGAGALVEHDAATLSEDVRTELPGDVQRRRASRRDSDRDSWSVVAVPPQTASGSSRGQEELDSSEGEAAKGSKSKSGLAGKVGRGAAGAMGGRAVSMMGGKKKASFIILAFILVVALLFAAGTIVSSTVTNSVIQRQQQAAQSLAGVTNPIYGAIAQEDEEALEIIRRCMAEYPDSPRAKAVKEIPGDSALNATAGEVNPGNGGESDPVVEVDGMNDRQVEHAMEIIAVSKEMGMDDEDAQIIALMVAKEESNFINLANDGTGGQGALLQGQDGDKLAASMDNPHSDGLPYDHGYGHGGDHGSVGVFQQQAGEGWWGEVDELMNVRIQARKFFERLKSVGYEGKDRALAGQEVQRSYDSTGNNYRRWEPFAEELLPQIADTPAGFNWDKYQDSVSAEEGNRPASATEEAEFHFAPNAEDPDSQLLDFVPVSVNTTSEGLEYMDEKGNVHTVQLVNDEPLPTKEGVTIEGGQNINSVRGARITAHRWPEISIIGGFRPGDSGDHGKGDAIDIMVDDYKSASSIAMGDDIAALFLDNHEELGVNYVIWQQSIAQPSTGSMDYKPMENRGSDTENHYDHVHVSFYPSSPYSGEDVYDIDADMPESEGYEGAEIDEEDAPTDPEGDVSSLVPSNSDSSGRGLDCRGVNSAPVAGSVGSAAGDEDEGGEEATEEVVVVVEEEDPDSEDSGEPGAEGSGPSPESVIAEARGVIGTPFAVGGGDENGPTRGLRDPESNVSDTGFDSPGLIYYSFSKSGGDIGRTYEEIVAGGESSTVWSSSDGRETLTEKTRPGDILVFDDGTLGIVTEVDGAMKYIISKSGAGVTETTELGGLTSAFRPY